MDVAREDETTCCALVDNAFKKGTNMQQNETFKLPFFINSNAGKRKLDWFADYGPTGGKKGDFVHQILCLSDAKKKV